MRRSHKEHEVKNESKFLKHIPCEECGSSDGNALHDDGHTYCHVCQTWKGSEDYVPVKPIVKVSKVQIKGTVQSIVDRGISSATSEFYDVRVGEGMHYYYYASPEGSQVAAKVRKVEDKSFHVEGEWSKALLFGQQKFNKGGKFLTITEGELDAMAAYQMMGSKYPVVSVRNGASAALKDCKAQYEWINSFETIVVCFDADEPGQKAASEVAELFGSKVKIFKAANGYKDACDYLKDGSVTMFTQDWWKAETYTPDGIVAGSSLWEEVCKPVEKSSALYPWKGVNDLTYGLRPAELVTVCAGSGLGKSQFLREILWHLIKTTDANVGCMFMEESVRKTALSVMSLACDKPLHLPDTVVSESEKEAAFNATLGTDRLYFWDNFGSTAIDNVINRIKYLAKACDCRYVFLDHISMVVSGQGNGDERKAIDELMTKLRTMVQETGITLIAVSHLKRPESKGHEEGAATSLAQLRGSGAIAQLSDIVIGLVRNAQAEDDRERNTTRVSVLKNRFSGMTSPHCASLLYSKDTGRMIEVDEEVL
jgi:twinkle protein